MSGRTPIPTGPTPKVKALKPAADNATSAAGGIEDPWKLISSTHEATVQVTTSGALQPAAGHSSASAGQPADLQVKPRDHEQSGVVRWGDLRAQFIKALSSPYDPNARQAAFALGIGPDFGFTVPLQDGLLGEIFSDKKNQGRTQLSWPQPGAVRFLQEQNCVPFPTPKTIVKARPWKASVVHARSWSDKHDDLRSKVLETWKSLLLSAGSLTRVGVSLLKAQEIPDAEARVMQIVNDVFLCKSTATLQARASALLHYVRWRNSDGLDPTAFPVDEEDAYEYVCFLRSCKMYSFHMAPCDFPCM